jgi:hypothetical protein
MSLCSLHKNSYRLGRGYAYFWDGNFREFLFHALR